MISHMVRLLRGSSPVVGSSRKITLGLPTSVIARSRRRRIPPEYVAAGDPQVPGVGVDERGEDPHHGGLAGAVRAEQREDGPGGNVEVDAVEHDVVAVRLAH
jgi:hypothetical protein